MAKILPLDYSLLYSITHKSEATKCTMYTWAVMQMWSHTPAPRHTQRDTSTDGRTRLQMQQDSKQTHTRVWCPSFYSLALPLCLSWGSHCGHMTHCCCCCYFMHVGMRLCSCAYCIYDCVFVHVWQCMCVSLYVSLPFAWKIFLPTSLDHYRIKYVAYKITAPCSAAP